MNPHTFDWDRAISFARELSMINSYEAAGKQEVISYMERLLRKETAAGVRVFDAGTDEPFLIASLKPEGGEVQIPAGGAPGRCLPRGDGQPLRRGDRGRISLRPGRQRYEGRRRPSWRLFSPRPIPRDCGRSST